MSIRRSGLIRLLSKAFAKSFDKASSTAFWGQSESGIGQGKRDCGKPAG
jgi:hypothetical protein